jgi:hypothetical protein
MPNDSHGNLDDLLPVVPGGQPPLRIVDMTEAQILTPKVARAAERYRAERGEAVEEAIGTDDAISVQMFLILAGYLDAEPTPAPLTTH